MKEILDLLNTFPKCYLIPIERNGRKEILKVKEDVYKKIVQISYENKNNKQNYI